MTASFQDLPNRSFAANGCRLAESWPETPLPASVDRILRHSPLEFVSAAQWRWREGKSIPSRRLSTTNLALYLGGSGTVWLAGRALRVGPGVLIITPRGWPQRVAHDPGQPFNALALHAQMPVFGGGDDLFAVLGLPTRWELDAHADACVPLAMAELARLDACRPSGWERGAQAWLHILIQHLLQRQTWDEQRLRNLPGNHDIARIAPGLALIDERLAAGRISLHDLADCLDLSAISVRRLFLRVTGRPPNRYIQARRIERASALLRSGTDIASVAAAVGCADASVFHRLFRTWTGTTPERWRQQSAW